jgi:hypothetical protein
MMGLFVLKSKKKAPCGAVACSGETGIANAFPYGEPSKWLVASCHRLPLRPVVLAGIGTKRRISLTRLAICGAPFGAPIGRSGLTRRFFSSKSGYYAIETMRKSRDMKEASSQPYFCR